MNHKALLQTIFLKLIYLNTFIIERKNELLFNLNIINYEKK